MSNITMDPPNEKRKLKIILTSDNIEMGVPHTPDTEYRCQQCLIRKHQLEDERDKRAVLCKNIGIVLTLWIV